MTITLAFEDGTFADLRIEPHEYGDPSSLTVRIPAKCDGTLHLSRKFFAPAVLAELEKPQ